MRCGNRRAGIASPQDFCAPRGASAFGDTMKLFESKELWLAGALITPALLAPALAAAQPQLEEVLVIASRVETSVREVGAAVSVLDQAAIALRGHASMAELLRTQPGIAVSNTGGPGKATALRIRGEEGHRTLVMIDGVNIADPTATQVGPQIQHLTAGTDIERVEILRGPQGFIYGADAGGVVNILTRTGGGFASEAYAEAGRYGTQRWQGFVANGTSRGDGFLSAQHLTTDGFNAHTSDTTGEVDGYENTTLHGKLGLNAGDAWRGQLVLRHTDATSDYDSCGSIDCVNEFTQSIARLSGRYQGERWQHEISLAGTEVARQNIDAGLTTFDSEGHTRKLDYLGSTRLAPSVTWVWGGDARNERITANDGERGERDQLGLFSEVQASVADALYVSAGLRFDDHDDFGEHLSHRLSAAYIQTLEGGRSLKYRSSWGTGFRAPSLSELFYNRRDGVTPPAADVTLREETSEGYDLGVEFYTASGYSVQLGYFDQRIEQEIYFDLLSFSGYLQGRGVSHSRGGELFVETPLASWLTLTANYTYNDTSGSDDQPRVRRPRHLLNLSASLMSADERWRTLVHWRASRDAESEIFGVGRVPLDDYGVMDVSTQFQVSEHLTLLVRLENALDEQYQEVNEYHTAGRAAYGGIKLTF